MDIKKRISEDMKTAMKEKNRAKVGTLRMLMSELQYAKAASGDELSESASKKTVSSYLKRLKKSLADFPEGDKKKQILEEIKLVEEYLPQKATREETIAVVKDVMSETETFHFGKVMKTVLERMGDAGDGQIISESIKLLRSETP